MHSEAQAKTTAASACGPLLLLLLMPAVAAGVVLGVQSYLGGERQPATLAMVASLALFIYAANGLSDGAEDTVNDPTRAATLRRHAVWTLVLSGAGIVGASLGLAAQKKLHAVYAGALLVGVAYSFRVVPHPLGAGRAPLRLKDVPLLKNVSIGVTWAAAAFCGPVLDLDSPPTTSARVTLVGVSYALLAAVNSLFCDVRDERGDRAAGVRTLPVRFGVERCYRATLLAMATWTAVLGAAFGYGALDVGHLVWLTLVSLGYPFTVYLVTTRVRPAQAIINLLIESSDILFALGLFALAPR